MITSKMFSIRLKSILSIFLIVILLSACGSEGATKTNTSLYSTSYSTSQTVTTDLAVQSLSKTPVEYEDTSNWMEEYYKALLEEYPKDSKRIGYAVRHLWLYDIDLDGIPELFLSYLGTVNAVIFHGYHFKEGKVTDINIPNDGMPVSLSLWKNNKTNEFMWLAEGSFRNSPGRYTQIDNLIDFSNLSSVKKSLFWAYDIELSENGDNPKHFYYLDGKNKKEMSLKDIENKLKEKLVSFEKVNILYFTSFTDEFLTYGEYTLSENNIDKDKLIEFFSKWTCSTFTT